MRNTIGNSRIVAAALGVAVAAIIGSAGVASAAPNGPSNAQQTIK